jgi:hypothetical protein
MPVTYDPLREDELTGDQAIDAEFDPFTRAAARTRRSVNRLMREPVQDDRDPQTVKQINRLLGQNGNTSSILDVLGGRNGVERVQTLPERIVRSGFTAPHDAMTGELPMMDPDTGHTSEKAIERASDLSNAVVGGSFPLVAARGAARNVLGSGMVPKEPVKPGPVFYSGVENALEHTTLGTATPEQWLGTLKNAKGVKPEEMDWLGVQEFLAEKQAEGKKVTRAELQDFVRNNKVDVKEVHKSTSDETTQATRQQAEQEIRDAYHDDPETLNDPELMRELVDEHFNALHTGEFSPAGNTKYSEYQLPGGKDYGELLLTLPENPLKKADVRGAAANKLREKYGENFGDYATPAEMDEFRKISTPDKPYHSSHWDEPNVLAHVRYNTRDIDGKKALHLEEIQSDWHQQGKKKGYKGATDTTGWKVDSRSDGRYVVGKDGKDIAGPFAGKDPADDALISLTATSEGMDGVPDAPFKKTWPELAFKRMLRHAADNGYDAISWTPGEAQAARYDLSKQLNKISYDKDTGRLRGFNTSDQSVLDQRNVSVEKLADYIGKEAADRLINKPSYQHEGLHELKGVDLKVGGEGMMRFYDDQLPVIAAKYGKAHGTKVEQRRLKSGLEINKDPETGHWVVDHPDDPEFMTQVFMSEKPARDYVRAREPTVHYMELPKSMRDVIQQKGFPLFSHGLMLTPVEGNPFEQKEPKK